tara:strand:- start:6609 stop:7049 length:441 start_codon:yes stop_codon:yes gene_type:complete
MLNKILPLIVLLLPSLAYADNGNFTYLAEGQMSPFKGTLFDDEATAHILTLPKFYELSCDLELDYQLGLQTEKYNFEIKDLQANIVFLEKEKITIVDQKDSRILLLEQELKKKNKNDKPWILAAGVAIGIGLTIGIVKSMEVASEN